MTPSPLLSPEDFEILRGVLALLVLVGVLLLNWKLRRVEREHAELKAELELLSSSYLASQALEGKPLAPIEWPTLNIDGSRFDSLSYLDKLERDGMGDVEA